MKRIWKLLSALLIGACFLSGNIFTLPVFAETVNPTDLHYVREKMYYSGLSTEGIEVSYATNLEQLLSADNTVQNQELAVTAEILASDIYDDVIVAPDANSSADCRDDTGIYYRNFGMDNVTIVDLGAAGYTQDTNDVSRFAVSHKNVTDGGTEKEIIVVAIEGTNGTYAQWDSNYDIGAGAEVYPGEHSGWLNSENHKGFDVAYNRVLAAVNDYISQNVSASAEKTILITGHSRGGAVANLLGKYFEDDPEYKSFTYTFAAPAVTTNADSSSASTIFNVINTDDTIPYFPLSAWGFHRYGTDLIFNMTDADLTARWQELTGIDYKSCSGSTLEELAAFVSADRTGLYVLNRDTAVCNKFYPSESAANDKIAEMKTSLTELGFNEAYYTFEVIDNESATSAAVRYNIKGYVSPAFLMQYMAGLASNSDLFTYMTAVGGIMKIGKIDSYNDVMTFMAEKYMNKSITYAHCTYAYYLGTVGSGLTTITGTVSISGKAAPGQTLTADYNDGNAGNTIMYQWIRVDAEGNETAIPEATAREYSVTDDDIGCKLKVTLTGAGIYSGSLTSPETDMVAVIPTTEPTPTSEPTATPTSEPTPTPTSEPTPTPTSEPTATPTSEPTATPTSEPTATPTSEPEPTSTPAPAAKYTVSFDVNGHGTAPESQSIESGGKVSRPADPAAEGYTFGGWYKEAGCENIWDFEKDTVTADTTLYAKWTKASSSGSNGSSGSGSSGSSNNTTGSAGQSSAATSGAKTGDANCIWLWLILAGVCAGVVTAAFTGKRHG